MKSNSKLYKFAILQLSMYVSNIAKKESIKESHLILDSIDVIDVDFVVFIIKNNGILSTNEINKLKKYLSKFICSYVLYNDDSSSSILPLAYYSTFGKLPRIFDEFLGFDGKFDFLYRYKNFDYSKFQCDWLLNETESALINFFSDLSVKQKIKKALKRKLNDKSLEQDKKSQFMDIFLKYCSDD